eukprot:CAMPEP_0116867146 /NCGR_PEP_ID=MMETSP0418-20121206/26451_1 /TAXON_ID=1158023 /ORGANISM="Astrosyne radiata, Strain 13vi08-1A" /LENGTH=226 /DNA_ID=CAMNT_0004502917 /DNA_START=155 /DNA_END=832 /DNA_ORIENTATION=-
MTTHHSLYVLCGKGKTCYDWVGNQRFRTIVGSFLDRYASATSKAEKSAIVTAIYQSIRRECPESGGFIKQDKNTGQWHAVDEIQIREKVGQTIRDALHVRYRSSSRSKRKRKKEEKAKVEALAKTKKAMETRDEKGVDGVISQKVQNMLGFWFVASVPLPDDEDNLAALFTKTNVEILNELNRQHQRSETRQIASTEAITQTAAAPTLAAAAPPQIQGGDQERRSS